MCGRNMTVDDWYYPPCGVAKGSWMAPEEYEEAWTEMEGMGLWLSSRKKRRFRKTYEMKYDAEHVGVLQEHGDGAVPVVVLEGSQLTRC
jgi:hypothetical protein